ncbi:MULTISPECIES: phage tail tape measure protein [Muribaculaceae]|mgnify:FL=1|jgi:TP901 family phage tail tape measure protein|uniref:phage tail tape measure protein n=3 Tax=Bacteroidales TaxID=171549 RepID=UPI0010A3FDD4|nr:MULTISPECIES: phage tail tape measure protein [Muribaculaceae]QCD40280.1 phage tail tape measure protein [Duncaniella sp. C9]QCP71382.1 phage tail tape measure protein [Duncaniella sp. B8]
MSNYNFNYAFNISGNCNAVVAEISGGVENLQRNLRATTSLWDTFEGKILALNQFTQYVGNLSQTLNETLAPGAALNASLADLQAISGATGRELETVERFARSTAREFGVSASGAVESYKLLLSQLSPELTKNTAALDAMGRNVAILSKTMGGDTTAAAEVLTTAMNQYGVSLEDPMEASRQMADMMNIMAAAGREGSAELPTIKVALEQCGMAAKAAGVSFAETNAAIQVLDKAGKKGSEGGVALRNVMSTLAQGRFLPKDVREELAAAGISVNDLTDKSKSLAERLQVLKPVMADDALFSKLFGKENSAAAMALVQGIPKVEQWTAAISGTNTAVEQSKVIMETYNERLARVQAKFDDIKISIFNSCGDLGIWTQVVVGALVPLSQLVPLIYGAAKAVMFLRSVNFKGAFTGVVSSIRNVVAGLMMQNIAITASGGYWLAFKVLAQNVCRSIGVAIMNIPIVGWIAAAIAAVIAIIQQLWDKCYGFRVAVFTAWEGIKALFSALWEWLSGLWQRISAFFVGLWNGIKSMAQKVANVFMAVVNKIRSFIAAIRNFVVKVVNAVVEKVSAICKPLVTAFKNVANAIKGFFGKIIDWVRDKFYALINWFIDKYNWIASKLNFDKIARLGREAADRSWAADHPEQPDDDSSGGGNGSSDPVGNGGGLGGGSPIGNALGSVGGSASKETDRVKNINITIDRLIDKFTITTNNLSESKERIKDAVAEALLSAVNDANYAL